ncbi:MAG: paraquat-inducible protein A [Burkholderiaceae bacterium]|nr:paraquat-inducible protein A [Burkholderiaceae bacterium]
MMSNRTQHRDVQRATPAGALIACPECDLLQQEVRLPPHGVAVCQRCGAELYHNTPNGLDRTLAFTLCGVMLYCLANLFPLLGLELKGNQSTTTLYGAVRALYDQKLEPVAVLVFVTTILVPGLELLCMTYMLLPLRMGKTAHGFRLVFRFVQAIHPWGMVEVFMLGILVSVVKLSNFASVLPGIALWSFAGLMVMIAAVAQSFNPRDLWLFVRARA